MKTYKTLSGLDSALARLKTLTGISAKYQVQDHSTQKQLLIYAHLQVRVTVDAIHCQSWVGDPIGRPKAWDDFRELEAKINDTRTVFNHCVPLKLAANARTKKGAAERDAASTAWRLEWGNLLLSSLPTKRAVDTIRATIAELQRQQTSLLEQMRAANSAVMAARRGAKKKQRADDAEALRSGRFWNASREALKDFFHPPFEKNYLADVSERWRAALYLECESVNYKTSRGWGHTLTGTGRAYLCGIDDNGDEWGHECHVNLGYRDEHYNASLEASVEEAMVEIFGLAPSQAQELPRCIRQGDLLFRPAAIPDGTPMSDNQEWEVRESHVLQSPSLEHNGRFFRSSDPICVTHTSHAAVELPAGEYELHLVHAYYDPD